MYGPTQCMSVSSPFNASYLKEENPAPVYLEWLSQVLPHFQFLNFELGKTSNTADSNVEVHAVACQANEADNLRNEILDAPDVVVPIKLWTFVNGKPLDSTLDCAVTRQISLLKQLPGYIRLCKGQSVGELLCIKTKKVREVWSIDLDLLSQRAYILLVVKVNSGKSRPES